MSTLLLLSLLVLLHLAAPLENYHRVQLIGGPISLLNFRASLADEEGSKPLSSPHFSPFSSMLIRATQTQGDNRVPLRTENTVKSKQLQLPQTPINTPHSPSRSEQFERVVFNEEPVLVQHQPPTSDKKLEQAKHKGPPKYFQPEQHWAWQNLTRTEVSGQSLSYRAGPIYARRTLTHATIDANLLEKELMSLDVREANIGELREKLSNMTVLEEEAGDNHRDYGSSFILPVLSAVNYDNNTVPLIFADIPVNVRVQLNILHLANFNSELMEYTIDVEMEMRWFDMRLANKYTKPVRIREKQLLDQIWRPDPYFVNSKYSYFHRVSFPNFRMRITPQGLVTYTLRTTLLPDCPMIFCRYPHDRQLCDLRIASIAYPDSFVRFTWHTKPLHFVGSLALPELSVEKIDTDYCRVEGKLIRSSCIRLAFHLERDGGRFIVEKYIPSTLAMMFAWVAPYVPYHYEDVRIVTPITVLLTLVQMEKGNQEVRTSYLTAIDHWFAAMKAFTVISLVESLVVLALIKQSRAMEKNAQRAPHELARAEFQSERRRLTRLYHRVDAVCRVLSPLMFVAWFAYYVLFVAQGDEDSCIRHR